MTIEEMRNRKRELGYTNRMIAEKAGIPMSTVQKIFSGATASPRRESITALEKVLKPYPDGMIRESHAAYSVSDPEISAAGQGSYTLADYLALPDEQRVELIDGVFYDMAAPTTIHQSIAGFLYKKFLDFVLEHKGPCYPFISPVDVQLDSDDRTVVQPDVLIVCDRGKYKNGRIFGAPDLIIEVLSPSTRKKDMQLKMYKYANAGVREYWMVDPDKKVIVQYDLSSLSVPAVYGFNSVIPVLIWESRCRIDLREMEAAVSFLWETD